MSQNIDQIKGLNGAAYNVARQYGVDQEDVKQIMVLHILERFAVEPTFLEQTPAYIVNYGAWQARKALRKEMTIWYDKVVDDELCQETVPAPDTLQLEMAMAQAIATLDTQNQIIAKMTACGYNAQEIAEEVGVSRKTVYNRINGVIQDAVAAHYC